MLLPAICPTASPESVGMSSERLDRIGAAMHRYVDDGKIAGMVTLVARHGKIVYRERGRRAGSRQQDCHGARHAVSNLLDDETDHRRRRDDVVRGRRVSADGSGFDLSAGVQGSEGVRRRPGGRTEDADDDAATVVAYGRARIRLRQGESGRAAILGSRGPSQPRSAPNLHSASPGYRCVFSPARAGTTAFHQTSRARSSNGSAACLSIGS